MTLTVGHSVLSVPGIGGVRLEDTFHLKNGQPQLLTHCTLPFELPTS